ncbi:glutathione S-transferase 3-like [Babylonia areolata]|uniref:glutathione S-transferase 3-like n=1 Tax=Babylonia areolata TaxID=304850 RepID=UPI003FD599C1
MADIQLFYFHEIRGRGEFLRMLLTAAGIQFEDVRIKMETWGAIFSETLETEAKQATPYGQLPYIIYKGKKYAQSIPMASYFAKRFGFYGRTDEDALKQEEVMHLVEDLRVPHVRDWVYAQGEKKAQMLQKLKDIIFPRYLGYFEALLAENGNHGFFVGHSVTMADMYLYDILETLQGLGGAEVLKDFPLLQKLCENVRSFPALKEYLVNRPKTTV